MAGEIKYEELRKLVDENSNIVLIDIRNPGDVMARGRIPGALNFPENEFAQAMEGLDDDKFLKSYCMLKPSTDQKLVFYGTGEDFELLTKAYDNAVELDFEKARFYCGGFNEWLAKDGPVQFGRNTN